MYKKLSALLIVFVLLFSSVPAIAASNIDFDRSDKAASVKAEKPVIYEGKITVTEKGGTYNIGFATLYFPPNFLEPERLPATFDVSIFAEDGVAGIEINPSTPNFLKPVYIYVDNYNGQLYDKVLGKNIKIKVKKQVVVAEHFSWFRFR